MTNIYGLKMQAKKCRERARRYKAATNEVMADKMESAVLKIHAQIREIRATRKKR